MSPETTAPTRHPSLRARRSNPGATSRGPWVASSQELLAMTRGAPRSFAGDVHIVRDRVDAGERRTLAFGAGPTVGYSAFSPGAARVRPGSFASCTPKRSGVMSKPLTDLRTDEEA